MIGAFTIATILIAVIALAGYVGGLFIAIGAGLGALVSRAIGAVTRPTSGIDKTDDL